MVWLELEFGCYREYVFLCIMCTKIVVAPVIYVVYIFVSDSINLVMLMIMEGPEGYALRP